MKVQKALFRFAAASLLGLAAVAACAGAAPAVTPSMDGSSPVVGADEVAKRVVEDAGADATPDGAPKCPNGALEDPHRGFVRCLGPDERDAGWLPPPPQGPADLDAGAAPPKPQGAQATVEVGKPTFENGEVPKIEKALQKALAEVAKCVNDNGGLTGSTGSLKAQFLVRSRGRAEGVEVVGKGVTTEAAACVRALLKNRAVGAPTADPTGVTVTLVLKPAK